MRRIAMTALVAGLVATPLLADELIQPRPLVSEMTISATAADEAAPDHPRAMKVVTETLALTDDQVAAWNTLLEAREAAIAPLAEQLKGTEQQLKELLKGDNPDAGAVGTLVISGKTLREGIQAAEKTYVQGFEALLTAEQKAKLGAVRRAARIAPVLPAFGVLGLLPPAVGQAG